MLGAQNVGGQASDIEIHAQEILRLRSLANDILARHTGQDVGKVALAPAAVPAGIGV